MKFNGLAILLILILFSSCGTDVPEKEAVKKNFIIVLDLSDRIIVNGEQIYNDSMIISDIYKLYINRAKNLILENDMDFNFAHDKISLIPAPQSSLPVIPGNLKNTFYKNLEKVGKENEAEFQVFFDNYQNQVDSGISQLYKIAHYSDNPNNYSGADIWEVFNTVPLENGYQNYIIVLTDGYMYVKDIQSDQLTDWKPVKRDLSSVKVAIMELRPKNNRGESNMMVSTWTDWLQKMKVSQNNILILPSGVIQNTIDQLNTFLDDSTAVNTNVPANTGNSSEKVFSTPIKKISEEPIQNQNKIIKTNSTISSVKSKPKDEIKKIDTDIKGKNGKVTIEEIEMLVDICKSKLYEYNKKLKNTDDLDSTILFANLSIKQCDEIIALYSNNKTYFKNKIDIYIRIKEENKKYIK